MHIPSAGKNTWKRRAVGGWWWGKMGSESVAICRWHSVLGGKQEVVGKVGGGIW
mgnify:CR=1 FL=1